MPNTRRGLGADVGRLQCARRGVEATGWLAAGHGRLWLTVGVGRAPFSKRTQSAWVP